MTHLKLLHFFRGKNMETAIGDHIKSRVPCEDPLTRCKNTPLSYVQDLQGFQSHYDPQGPIGLLPLTILILICLCPHRVLKCDVTNI